MKHFKQNVKYSKCIAMALSCFFGKDYKNPAYHQVTSEAAWNHAILHVSNLIFISLIWLFLALIKFAFYFT